MREKFRRGKSAEARLVFDALAAINPNTSVA